MPGFVSGIEKTFKKHANPDIAAEQKRYMKNLFDFLGIPNPLRKQIQKPFPDKKQLPGKETAFEIIKELWQKPEREYQYFALDLLEKYIKQFEEKDIDFLEYLVTHKSWWDTVDKLAAKFFGAYFKKFPEKIPGKTASYIDSGNIWLQRTALLFQLKYKEKTDRELLEKTINRLKDTGEFFIDKAIGWILREYSKTNPGWVADLVERVDLSKLSKKEALKIINKK